MDILSWQDWPPEQKRQLLEKLLYDFELWRLPQQEIPPDSEWRYYLNLSGRGGSKTKLASEEIRRRALARPNTRINLVAPTHGDARDTNLEGDSGILSVCGAGEIKKYLKNNGQVIFKNGSRLLTFSAQEPERLRGKQSHYAFLDEFAAFDENAREILTQIQMSNRLGTDPKVYITTTPKPLEILNELIARPDCHLVVCGTLDNPFLATSQVRELVERYANTAIGQQELFGQLLKEAKDALWTRKMIEDYRIRNINELPQFVRTIVAVDPSRTDNKRSDEAGIMVGSIGADGHYYIREDLSVRASPQAWAKRAINAYRRYHASLIVVEKSDGDLVKTILKNIDPTIPLRFLPHQRKGKTVRADPAAALYEQGKVHHVGFFAKLEDQLTGKVAGDTTPDDRYDALVYLLKELSTVGKGGQFISARANARTTPPSRLSSRQSAMKRLQGL